MRYTSKTKHLSTFVIKSPKRKTCWPTSTSTKKVFEGKAFLGISRANIYPLLLIRKEKEDKWNWSIRLCCRLPSASDPSHPLAPPPPFQPHPAISNNKLWKWLTGDMNLFFSAVMYDPTLPILAYPVRPSSLPEPVPWLQALPDTCACNPSQGCLLTTPVGQGN